MCRAALKDTLHTAAREYVVAIVRNLAISLRSLRKAPAFTIAAVLTLGLATGATAAVFSLVNGVVLRPLPWRHPDAVGLVWAIPPSGERTWLSFPELEEIRRQITSFSSVAGFSDIRFAYRGTTEVIEVQALAVSHDFFRVLGEFGVRLALGGSPGSIRRLMLRDGLHLTAAGCTLGVFFSWAIVRAASSLLFQTTAADIEPYAIGVSFVLICTTVTLWIPARRASRFDPAVALRQD